MMFAAPDDMPDILIVNVMFAAPDDMPDILIVNVFKTDSITAKTAKIGPMLGAL